MPEREQEWIDSVRMTAMLLSDKLPEKSLIEAIYMPGLSQGMIGSGNLFTYVTQLRKSCRSDTKIAFNGSDGEAAAQNSKPGDAWPGKNWYYSEFAKLGISPVLLTPTGPGLHTKGEAVALVTLAKEHGWKRVVIVTVPWHFVQFFSCLVSAMEANDYWFAAYASVAQTDWYLSMKGSQGILQTYPVEEAARYAPKVLDYHEHGYAAPFIDVFLYHLYRERIGQGELITPRSPYQ